MTRSAWNERDRTKSHTAKRGGVKLHGVVGCCMKIHIGICGNIECQERHKAMMIPWERAQCRVAGVVTDGYVDEHRAALVCRMGHT